jgi:hypothetical protein
MNGPLKGEDSVSSSVLNVTFECSNAASVAQFWSKATGWLSLMDLPSSSMRRAVNYAIGSTVADPAKPPPKSGHQGAVRPWSCSFNFRVTPAATRTLAHATLIIRMGSRPLHPPNG